MEYVDNSLDDAENLYKRKDKSYKRNIKIKISIGANPYTVVIEDNCNGMDRRQLTRLIQNVGESMKHSRFTNGQFGFGIHAFRAAAKHMRIVSRARKKIQTLVLDINRDSMDFTAPRVLQSITDTSNLKSGTQVFISDFDNAWSEGLDVSEIVNEIQFHFGGMLERKNLSIVVQDAGKSIHCKAFNYKSVEGKKIKKKMKIECNNETHKVEVNIWVSPVAIENQGCYFVAQGRRIHEIHEIKSFMKCSVARWSVWSHPNIVGYIEVGAIVEPVITRDEFRRTHNRSALYRAIVSNIEPLLLGEIEKVNKRRRVLEMGRLGNILSKCFNVAVKKEKDRNKGLSNYLDQMKGKRATGSGKRKLPEEWTNQNLEKPEEDNEGNPENAEKPENAENPEDPNNPADPNNPENEENKPEDDVKEPEAKRKKRETKLDKLKRVNSKFRMVFVNDLKDTHGKMQRSLLLGEEMLVNVSHPDFMERIHTNRGGSKLTITERLCSYIANISANSYKCAIINREQDGLTKYSENQNLLFEEILDLEFSMESSLRKYLPAIQKEVAGGRGPSLKRKKIKKEPVAVV